MKAERMTEAERIVVDDSRRLGRRSFLGAASPFCPFPLGSLAAYCWRAGRAQDVRSPEQLLDAWKKSTKESDR